MRVIRPADTGVALENPGMGWVFHFYDNVPANYGSKLAAADTIRDFPGLTTVYLRIPWSYLEPEEGKFNWSVLDSPAQRWISEGKKTAFRFSCSESWMRYATPEWVHKAGAKGYNFLPGKGVTDDGPFWEPDYNDPVFLEKHGRFLAAAAARYDGAPEVAFIDVGSFGVWGEGHTFSSTGLKYSAETVKNHIDLYCRHFSKTLLAANDDFSFQGDDVIPYALGKGMALRDDSILVQGGKNAYFHAGMAQSFWPTLPVILESEHYGGSRDRGNWKDGSQYLLAVEQYHASYVSIHWWPREFLDENRELVEKINRRLGYRIQLVEASWPERLRVGDKWRFSAGWRNAGVAPCLPGGYPAITLKDAKGGIAGVFTDQSFDVRALTVSEPDKAKVFEQSAEFTLPFNLQGGKYDFFVSIGTKTGTPQIALPLPDSDGQRRYRIGSIIVCADYALDVGQMVKKDKEYVLPFSWTVHIPLPEGAKPFCHFDYGDAIAFQGIPETESAGFSKTGRVDLGCAFTIPEHAKGKAFAVRAGLWVPDRMGKSDERMIPDEGLGDRRVDVGRLEVPADGEPIFTPTR